MARPLAGHLIEDMARQAFNRVRPDFRTEVQLLIVQRNELFARSLARYLGGHYSRVHVAGSAAEAEHLLRTTDGQLHLVCGQLLGASDPDGITCIEHWRAAFPRILRAILATGAEGVPTPQASIDGVFRKPSDPAELLELLQVSSLSTYSAPQPHIAAFNPDPVPTEDTMKTTKTKAHDLKTLKDRTAVATRPGGTAPISTAQGFTII